MKHLPLLLILSAGPAFCQDGCAGAMSALTRVKEEITPDLADKDELRTMQTTLQAASANCRDQPEILYYRSLVAERLGDAKETRFIGMKLKELRYKPSYSSPFSKPEAAAAPPPDESTSVVGSKWALVVGINQFQDTTITPLRFAKKDSSDFADYLTDPKGGRFQKDRVKVLLNEKATLEEFRTGFGWLRQNVQPGDLVVIYISSHGSPREMDPNGVSYIIMSDTKRDDSAKLFATSLQMIDLVQQINRELKARRVVLFLDTCFSGDASATGREESSEGGAKRLSPIVAANAPAEAAFSGALQNLKIGVGRAVITASRANEESFENLALHNGYFTSFLIKELRSGADKPLGDIFPKVRDEVLSAVKKDHPGKTQTPSCEFSDRASTIVLAVPDTNGKAPAAE